MVYSLKYINLNTNAEIEFSLKSGIIVSSKTGFTEHNVNLSMSQSMSRIGESIQGRSVPSKPLTITGEILGKATSKRKKMLEVISPLTKGKLIYNDEWQIFVEPSSTPTIQPHLHNARYQFTVRAAYPYWQNVNATHTHVAGLKPLFKFPWNISDPSPFKFSERIVSLFANVFNSGNVPINFVIYFRALSNVLNPKIIKVSTQEFMMFNIELTPGDVLKADFERDNSIVTLTRNGIEEEAFGLFDIDSTLFPLDPGDNVLRYDSETNIEGLDVRIEHSETIVGVY